MNLIKTKINDLSELQTWFSDKQSSYFWGGPGLRFPFTDKSFLEDICWGEMTSLSVFNSEDKLIAFGQYYESLGRCHLARLVVSPVHRKKGLGKMVIEKIMAEARADLKLKACSLFVIKSNQDAVRCYQSLGFKLTPYPAEKKKFKDINFMVLN